MNNTDINILNYIHKGRENAVSRERLRQLTGLTDSKMRELIREARKNVPIINLSDGCGYYIPTKEEEVDKYIRQEEHRAKSIFANLQSAKEYRKKIKGQMYFADVI